MINLIIRKVLFLLFRGLFSNRYNLILEGLSIRQECTVKHPTQCPDDFILNRFSLQGLSRQFDEGRRAEQGRQRHTANRTGISAIRAALTKS